jgi:signal transduction histidine kinase
MSKPVFASRALVLSFGAVTAGFVAATALAEHADVEIRDAAASIVANSSESIVQISAMRSDVRRFEVMVDDYVDEPAPTRRVKRDDVLHVRDDVLREWEVYRHLPTYADERELARTIDGALAGIDVVLSEIFDEVAAAHSARAEELLDGDLKPRVDRLDVQLAKIGEINRAQGVVLAARIDELGRRSIALAIWLDTLCVGLAVIFAALLVRADRRYRNAIQTHTEELELFSSRVAHDILGPLSSVSLAFELIARRGSLDDRSKEMCRRGQANLQRVRRLVDDLWEFARAGATPAPNARAEIATVVGDVVDDLRPVAEDAHAELRLEPLPPAWVRASDGVLSSLVANLVRNALKHMGDANERLVTVRVLDRGATARFEVQDTGPGVPLALRAAVFDPYVRGKQQTQPGLGLGLATVKRFAERHGGLVGLEAPASGGSLFWFELPKAAE